MKNDITQRALHLHKKLKGKIGVYSKTEIKTRDDLSLVYTPGVAAVSSYLATHKTEAKLYTMKKNFIAVISDGSAVLGLGNIGPEGAFPVMEGKCLLFKRFADIDAIPIVLSTQNTDTIIETVLAIAPTFGGINLEDIAAPRCFIIEDALKKRLEIPVIHDDQWGAATVILAALINALKIVQKNFSDVKIVVSGAGAAGSAIVKILHTKGVKNILVCDRKGIIYPSRQGNTSHKEELAKITNPQRKTGDLRSGLKSSDVFIGVSSPGIVSPDMVASMHQKSIVFALANPIPEIMPDVAKKAGAYIVATGRSDFPNQVNNALVFPGIFRGALDHEVKTITINMLIHAAENLAGLIKNPTPERIIPSLFDNNVVKTIASVIRSD